MNRYYAVMLAVLTVTIVLAGCTSPDVVRPRVQVLHLPDVPSMIYRFDTARDFPGMSLPHRYPVLRVDECGYTHFSFTAEDGNVWTTCAFLPANAVHLVVSTTNSQDRLLEGIFTMSGTNLSFSISYGTNLWEFDSDDKQESNKMNVDPYPVQPRGRGCTGPVIQSRSAI
jgi:hypothetical protein